MRLPETLTFAYRSRVEFEMPGVVPKTLTFRAFNAAARPPPENPHLSERVFRQDASSLFLDALPKRLVAEVLPSCPFHHFDFDARHGVG